MDQTLKWLTDNFVVFYWKFVVFQKSFIVFTESTCINNFFFSGHKVKNNLTAAIGLSDFRKRESSSPIFMKTKSKVRTSVKRLITENN